jgi:hypothetical protein
MKEDVLATGKRERVVLAHVERGVGAMKERGDDRDVLGQIGERQVLRGEERRHRGQRDDPENEPLATRVVQGVRPPEAL